MWFFRRSVRFVLNISLAILFAMLSILRVPQMALSQISHSLTSPVQPALIAANTAQEVEQEFKQRFICVKTSEELSLKYVGVMGEEQIRTTIVRPLADQLKPCIEQNRSRIGIVDVKKLINVVYTTRKINSTTAVVVVGVGITTQQIGSNSNPSSGGHSITSWGSNQSAPGSNSPDSGSNHSGSNSGSNSRDPLDTAQSPLPPIAGSSGTSTNGSSTNPSNGSTSVTPSGTTQSTPQVADGTVINEPSTSEKPPLNLALNGSDAIIPVGPLNVYTVNPNISKPDELDISHSTGSSDLTFGEGAGIPEDWQAFLQSPAPKVYAFQPINPKTGATNQSLHPPAASQSVFSPNLTAQPVPKLGGSESGAVITQVRVDHNLPFDQTTKGLAVTISSDIWNSQGQIGSVNVYIKRPDGSYVKAKAPQYSVPGQNIFVSGQSIKIPSNRVSLKSVVYVPLSVLDLPSGQHKDLKLQVQVQLQKAVANDENYRVALSLDRVAVPSTGTATNSGGASLPVAEAYLINGYTGCCVPSQVEYVLRAPKGADTGDYGFHFKGLGIKTIIGNWDNLSPNRSGLTVASDQEFRRQMRKKLREGDPNVPVILIGHSFGADSLLKVAQCEAGNNDACPSNLIISGPVKGRKILFLGIIDGVEFGGKRTRRTVPNNVTYLFNRWTDEPSRLGTNIAGAIVGSFAPGPGLLIAAAGIPIDHNSSGQLACKAQQCDDQEKQSIKRAWNGDPSTEPCGFLEKCPGWSAFNPRRNGRKQVRVDHAGLALDDRVQYQMLEALTKLLENQPAPNLTGSDTGSNSILVRNINLTVNLRDGTCSPDCSVRESQDTTGILVNLPISTVQQFYTIPPGDELAESLTWEYSNNFAASTPEQQTFVVPRTRKTFKVARFTVKTKQGRSATGTVSITVSSR